MGLRRTRHRVPDIPGLDYAVKIFEEIAAAWRDGRRKNATRGRPPATKPKRVNPWPRCQQCRHRVPSGAIHGACRRAFAIDLIPDTHPGVCCPGICTTCWLCVDRCEFAGRHPVVEQEEDTGE